jgi:hypothetical protein
MSSVEGERVPEHRLELSLPDKPESSLRATLEVRPDSHTVLIQMPGVSLAVTGDAYEQFMVKLMRSALLPKQELQHMIVSFSLPWHPVLNVQNSLSIQESVVLSTTMSIEMPVGLISWDLRES